MMCDSRGAAGRCLLAGSLMLAACGGPTGLDSVESSFDADIRGSRSERVTGTATASIDPALEFATQINGPDGSTFSVIALVGRDSKTISFSRSGTELPVGTHKIGNVTVAGSMTRGAFSAAYVTPQSNGRRLSLADSGSITITESGNQVRGTFVFYASKYDVIPPLTPEMVGKPITHDFGIVHGGATNPTLTDQGCARPSLSREGCRCGQGWLL
jgi:hypothetical protein